MTNLGTRSIVAVVGIPIVIVVSLAGGLFFFLFIALLSSVALWEFYHLAEAKGAKPLVGLGIATGVVVNLSFYHPRLQIILFDLLKTSGIMLQFPTQTQLFFIIFIFGVVAICLVELFHNDGSPLINTGVTLLGVVYIPLFFGTLIGLRELFVPLNFPMLRYFPSESSFMDPRLIAKVYSWGGYTVVSLFACIWICDSAAYFVGRALGKHKLFPRVSPNKTWEGAIAGFLAAISAAIAARSLVLEYMTLAQAFAFGLLVGLFGQVGDLIESLLKRDAGAKDSSFIIPGHGGIFDRFDSLIFASPIVYLYFDYIVFSRLIP